MTGVMRQASLYENCTKLGACSNLPGLMQGNRNTPDGQMWAVKTYLYVNMFAESMKSNMTQRCGQSDFRNIAWSRLTGHAGCIL